MNKEYDNLILNQKFNNAELYVSEPFKSIVIKSTGTYITIEEFKDIFNAATKLIKQNGLTKTIFDKRSLKVFHQPSMLWYFTEWKEEIFALNVKKHIKILPNDFVFKSSVKIGRQKIDEQFPNAKFHQTEIIYCENLDEALKA